MDALSMVEMGTHTSDPVAPARTAEKSDQQFGAVLNEKQQPRQQHESKPVNRQPETSVDSKDQQAIAHNKKVKMKEETAGQKELLNEVVVASSSQPEGEVQTALVDLMKAIVQGESTENVESPGSIDTLLTDLVQQLESTDLNGEQVLAGVDLSVLVEDLQSLNQCSNTEDVLAQLVTQLEEQLNQGISLLQNVELAAGQMAEPSQQNIAPVVIETLAQARQVLQKAFDSVVSQKSTAVEGAVVEQQNGEMFVSMEETAEEIDPRFAGLLKPRTEQRPVIQQPQSTREQVQLHGSKQAGRESNESVDIALPEEMVTQEQDKKTVQLPVGTAEQVLKNLAQQGQNHLQSQGQVPISGMNVNQAMPQPQIVQLASGQQVADSQIFDQVVTQISGSVNGESGRMVLRLQPAELGSLKLELMVEGDRIRANLHAQSHQVQDVLERNLPQLRNALAEQGLKIDQFQVNIDKNSDQQSQFENLAQQQQHKGSEKQPGWHQQNLEPEEQMIPLAHLMKNGGGGISLHV
ncbi:MAG: flagellar hook-length control protein FliK [Thermodesulfobacteriota bacterium]|nr:flagellar hook-length control protein FliK [Thermodesulfobacteriota bacterium]